MKSELSNIILKWYDKHHRILPWRAPMGILPKPYHVWLSEIMLQQTTVHIVKPYFNNFIQRWPTIIDLSKAHLDEILYSWQGLGYYARARNLYKCAQIIVLQHNGYFPETEEQLLKLPGIGPYTAYAIAAIAFNRHTSPVDSNITRIITRIFALEKPVSKILNEIQDKAHTLTPKIRSGDYAQALMDIGSTICIPKKPRCNICPCINYCEAYKLEITDHLPKKNKKVIKPTRVGYAFWLRRTDNQHILIRRRKEKGLLGGLYEIPTSTWKNIKEPNIEMLNEAPIKVKWKKIDGIISHQFTHFKLNLTLVTATISKKEILLIDQNSVWTNINNLSDFALSTLMKKVIGYSITNKQ